MQTRTIVFSSFFALATLPVHAADIVQTGSDTTTFKVTTDVFKLIDEDSVAINFAPGSKTLTAASKASISKFAKDTNNEGKVEKVIIAAWSDKDYPEGSETRTKADIKLAKERGEAVEKVLKADHAKSMSVYNMAQKPGWIAREFDTKGDLLKTGGTGASSTDELYRQIGERLKNKGGPGKVVLVAKFKNEVAAMH